MSSLKAVLVNYLKDLLSFRWLVLAILVYFYTIFLKNEIVRYSVHYDLSINNWDITLSLLNDMYIIVYFIIPIILFLSTNIILSNFNYLILIRLGSIKKWIFISLKKFWKKISFLLILWIFISFYLTIGLPFSWNWSQFSKSSNFSNTLNEVSTILLNPVSAFILQLILIVFALSLLHLFMAFFYVITKSKNFLMILSVIMFISFIIGFKLLPKEYAFLSPTTYFSLTKFINSFGSLSLGIGTLVGLGIIFFLSILVVDLNRKRVFQLAKTYLLYFIYVLLFLLGIVTNTLTLEIENSTILDGLVTNFQGSSSKNFQYSPFFYYSIVFFGLVYLINLNMSNELNRIGYYKIIRFKNLEKWFWSWFKKVLLKIIFLIVVFLFCTIIIGTFMGLKTNFDITVFQKDSFSVLYHFIINGFLQIIFYVLLIFVIAWIKNEASYGLILISIYMVAMLPGINNLGIIPVGLNSMVYLSEYSPYRITLILLMANIIVYTAIKNLFTKSLKI